MKTSHEILLSDSRDLHVLQNESVDLVVTSPPYPMIQMWDELFSSMSEGVKQALDESEGDRAFELMHLELDKIWRELYRTAKDGSFVCINIGDAVRTVGGKFQLYSNHSRIISACKSIGFDVLPAVLWRKQTNAPNKFMGSGMLPAGAYVTLEHEYILIFRKGNKRVFKDPDSKKKRMESSFFWEERNQWFSDLWDFKGTAQVLKNKELRGRSAAFPFELAYRLINMYSLKNDLVLDPFLGTGTTCHAAAACGRNSLGVEIDENFSSTFFGDPDRLMKVSNERLRGRHKKHLEFISAHEARKGPAKYVNEHHGFPVVTRQETGIVLHEISALIKTGELSAEVSYRPLNDETWSQGQLIKP